LKIKKYIYTGIYALIQVTRDVPFMKQDICSL